MSPTVASIHPAGPDDQHSLSHVEFLFRAYATEFADSIAESLCFQSFEAEIAGLPGRYAPPSGCLLLAMDGDRPAGCVALRDLGGGTCEMKRLYVLPEHRGRGLGGRLVAELLHRAEQAGYGRMVLDTVPEMTEALELYRRHGFVPTAAYHHSPVERTIYLERRLSVADAMGDRPPADEGSGGTPYLVAAAQRDDGSLTAEDLIRAYEAGPGQLREAMAGMTPEQLRTRPVPGRWSTQEVLCHLGDCEQFFADRIKRTIAMERPLLIGADGSGYPGPLRYHDRDTDEELELITLNRRQMVRILRLIDAEAWERTAVHTETGLLTLRQLVLHAVRHQDHHLRFVAEKRRALGCDPPAGEGANGPVARQ